MSTICKMDPRDAIPSWSGYNYQGQIAIVTIMELLNNTKSSRGDIDNFELGLEDIEDFSIYRDGKLVSTHQVKATNGTTIGAFVEALYYLAVGLTSHAHEAEAAYLHTSHELTSSNWGKEIKESIESYIPDKILRLETILSDADALNEEVRILKTKIKPNGKIDGRISKERLEIVKMLEPFHCPDDISPDSVRIAIREYLDGLSKTEFFDDIVYRRIKSYQYFNGSSYLPTSETVAVIENLIREYWGEELTRLRKANISVYRNQLQYIIYDHVCARHNNPRISKRIPLTIFCRLLDNDITIDGEQRILMEKDVLFTQQRNFCEEYCTAGVNCDLCDLYDKMQLFVDMNASEFEKACYMLSPYVKEDISNETSRLLDPHGLYGSTFPALQTIIYAMQTENNGLVYLLDKHYLLTDIHLSRAYRGHIFQNILNNPTVERICGAITQNREFGPLCMEIDSLVVSDDTEQDVPDIFEAARSIGYRTLPEDGKPSYMKITHKKQVSMIAATKLIDFFRRNK